MSRAWATIDLGAVAHNVEVLRGLAAPAELCAVVKADGYGHGALSVARTALEAGATRLAVAQVEEGLALRGEGIDAPIWVLSEPDPAELVDAARARLEPAVYSTRLIRSAAAAAEPRHPLTVHLKIDSGMHRAGAAPVDAVALAGRIVAAPNVHLGSVWTHLASADALTSEGWVDPTATVAQLGTYQRVLDELDRAGIDVALRHAANSAGTINHPASHFDVVRCGIALYGLPPAPAMDGWAPLRPALRWHTQVAFVKRVPAGRSISYGHRHTLTADTNVVTIPLGYADGFPRGLWNSGGAVLIGGRRRPILGVVTMDQTMVDCGDDDVAPGDEVVVIGHQGDAVITADDLAAQRGTINYEICTSISNRVARRYT
jgi:alanine racemase